MYIPVSTLGALMAVAGILLIKDGGLILTVLGVVIHVGIKHIDANQENTYPPD